MRNVEWDDEQLLREQEQVRTEGMAPAPAPVASGLSAAALEAQLTSLLRLANEGELGELEVGLAEIIERLQQRADAMPRVPVWREDFAPVSDRQRHQREALRSVMFNLRAAPVSTAMLDEMIAAVESGF
jgi:hypothetical protein